MIKKLFSRIWGRAYGPYKEFSDNSQKYGGKLNSHVEAEWTMWEHWAHNNYQRGHLPQLCICASGWKARILALFFWPPPPFIPYDERTS